MRNKGYCYSSLVTTSQRGKQLKGRNFRGERIDGDEFSVNVSTPGRSVFRWNLDSLCMEDGTENACRSLRGNGKDKLPISDGGNANEN